MSRRTVKKTPSLLSSLEFKTSKIVFSAPVVTDICEATRTAGVEIFRIAAEHAVEVANRGARPKLGIVVRFVGAPFYHRIWRKSKTMALRDNRLTVRQHEDCQKPKRNVRITLQLKSIRQCRRSGFRGITFLKILCCLSGEHPLLVVRRNFQSRYLWSKIIKV